MRPLKYRNKPTVVDGRRYASQKEAKRAGELRLLERAGEISGLREQVTFPLDVNGTPVTSYRADFVYLDRAGRQVVEDAKGVETEAFKIKRKLMDALLGVKVVTS